MAQPTNKTELLDQIRAGRAAWDALLARVPAERRTQPGATGEWSLKDVLAHLAFYERYVADELQAAARGAIPAPHPAIDELDTDAANAWIYQQSQDRPLAEVRADEQQAYEAVLAAVEALPDEALFTPHRFAWVDEDYLWQAIPGNVHEHYEEHTLPLQAWLAGARA